MNRVNFARVSGVVVDVCRAHGAFLDAGELERIRAFLAAEGGRRSREARALAKERARRSALRERLAPAEVTRLPDPVTWNGHVVESLFFVSPLDLLDLFDLPT